MVCNLRVEFVRSLILLLKWLKSYFLQGNDTIYGGGGSDDIYGGHHKRHGEDTGDVLYGGDMDDVVLGDNGEIIREMVPQQSISVFPWRNGIIWRNYPEPFDSEVIRDVRLYDDIDYVEVRYDFRLSAQ